ncbi:hypothetical protein [Paracoccus aestuariivivens]|uniref:TonB family protein n=1 Tax=Paracoccus aestuariivivens TaxID=1820333 RepID=A0A6L6J1W4_9RHOB|nr:hypothetical protein [Paracoccus aestuariivivens]MTH76133.1 hypothetical protein [Paracoccus aestuariivivens]
MLRTVLSSLCVVLALSTPCLAEQAGGSGLPPPRTQAEWIKAAQLRLGLNVSARMWVLESPKRGTKGETVTIGFRINPDGSLADVAIVKASDGLSARTLANFVKAFEGMPRMPPFPPDMKRKSYVATVPLRLN